MPFIAQHGAESGIGVEKPSLEVDMGDANANQIECFVQPRGMAIVQRGIRLPIGTKVCGMPAARSVSRMIHRAVLLASSASGRCSIAQILEARRRNGLSRSL